MIRDKENKAKRRAGKNVVKQTKLSYNTIFIIDLLIVLAIQLLVIFIIYVQNHYKIDDNTTTELLIVNNPIPIAKEKIIEITTAGDCTLGADTNFGYSGQFDWWFKNKAKGDYGYFFEKVKYLFNNDDYSYVNLEGTLTTYDKKVPKAFNFKGDPSYTKILLSGGIEGVNLANNHSNDYGTIGYNDTKKYLTEASIDYFGHEYVLIKNIQGMKFAFVGYTGVGIWLDSDFEMANKIKQLKRDGVDIVIANFHWGIEYAHSMTNTQIKRAHMAIDSGADIVIGSHPHCLQGIEVYNGKYIVYSLGNFVFGGNSAPKQIGRECLIVKMYFHFFNGRLTNVEMIPIPCIISSISSRNNYQPIVAQGNEKKRMINTINKHSINYKYVEREV